MARTHIGFIFQKNVANPYFGIEVKANDTLTLYSATLFSIIGADETIDKELHSVLSMQSKYSGELINTDLILPVDSNLTYI